MAAITPLAAALEVSLCDSQHATANDSNAAPARRPTINPVAVSSGAPSNDATGTDGEAASATPAMASHAAVTVSRLFTIVFSPAVTVSLRRATVEGEILPAPPDYCCAFAAASLPLAISSFSASVSFTSPDWIVTFTILPVNLFAPSL
jgi:hypothetical protein